MSATAKITKERVKTEIDKVRDEYLGVLYRIVLSLEEPANGRTPETDRTGVDADWAGFISEMYGSTAEAPLERGAQGQLETRLALE